MSKKSGVAGKTVPQLHRAQAAQDRRLERESRSAAEQLRLLDTRPGDSRRERARLGAA